MPSMTDAAKLRDRLERSERLLQGIADATNCLLTVSDYQQSVNQALATLGHATQVDRIYIFTNHLHPVTQEPAMSQLWEWVAAGITPEINNPDLQNLLYSKFFPRWYVELSAGRPIAGLVKDFSASERAILEPQGILSILVVPIQIGETFWGFAGFDECKQEHLWTELEISTLRAICGSFGGIFARNQAEMALRDLNRSLESRIQERTAELQIAKDRADAANHAKSEFLASMSHELRTPLNGILGYTQILSRTTLTDSQRYGIEVIHQSGSYLLTLINDVLDLAKIEARKMELHPVPCYLPALLEGVAEVARIQAEQKKLAFIYQTPNALPSGIGVDEKRLRQVLLNLLGNAVKFTDQGQITLTVIAQSTPSPDTSGLRLSERVKLWFQIKDTGVGMSAEQLQPIFLPFEQVGSPHRHTEGTGLGLAISQQIVDLMGSQIQVHSQLGLGSAFEFEVECPVVEDWANAYAVTSSGTIQGYVGQQRRILVVDDRWENRSVLVNLLSPLGFAVIEANHGQEALAMAHNYPPDLIISDLKMPVMDGWELLAQVRQTEALKHIPVIVSSASVFDTDRHKSFAAGGNDFLPKPIQSIELYRILAQHLQLEWIYIDEIPSSQGETVENLLQFPPINELKQLLDYSMRGQIKELEQGLEMLTHINQDYYVFSNQLMPLVKGFEITQIRQFLQQAVAQSQEAMSSPAE